MEPVRNLLAAMIDARDAQFARQLRRSREGRSYFECMAHGCKAEATAPHVHCDRHLSEVQKEQAREIERERAESPQARAMRLRIEGKAQQLANEAGTAASWRDRRFMLRAQRIIEAIPDGREVV